MKVRIKFSKEGSVKFIGHLDIMRYFQKAIRRADIDIAYSGGFNPHQIMSFAAPLGVGQTSESEYFDIELHTAPSMEELVERIVRWGIHPEDLVTNRFTLDHASEAFALMNEGKCGKVAVVFDEEIK